MKLKLGVALVCFTAIAYGVNEEFKHSLYPNMVHLYNKVPESVDSLSDMFSQGLFYGRLRFNSFGFKWKDELQISSGKSVKKDHLIAAVGGSVIYKSGYLNGFSFSTGLYGTFAQGSLDRDEAYLYKAGKGSFSRYDRLIDGTDGVISLAQAYLAYRYEKTEVKVGRQIFESFLTRSNDTKMIPNTFEGVSLVTKEVPKTVLKVAYLTRQKLRDHSEFHSVLAYGKVPSTAVTEYTGFTQNDDSSVHLGLTKTKLNTAGIDDNLVVFDFKNNTVEDLTLFANYTAVPELFSSAMFEFNYKFDVADWSIIPGLRYMYQFDNGAGSIGSASRYGHSTIKGVSTLSGYNDPESLDSWLVAARLDLVHDNLKFRLGYTKIADKADIIAPWRGFPTTGYTRAMAQYNWYANTESYMLQVDYHPETFYNIFILGRFVYQDFDDKKPVVQADSKVFTLDVMEGFGSTSSVYMKVRYAHVWGKDDTPIVGVPDVFKLDKSYDELRLEVNYLF